MITALSQFQTYFTNLVAAEIQSAIDTPEIGEVLQKVVFVTDWTEILDWQLDNSLYPCLVVELPEVMLSDVGGFQYTWMSSFNVIKGLRKDETPTYYFGELNKLLEIALRVHRTIFCDSENDGQLNEKFDELTIDQTLYPIIKGDADNVYGWRADFKLVTY